MNAAAAVVRTRIGVSTYVAPPGALVEEEAVDGLRDCLDGCVQAGEVQLVLDFSNVALIASPALEALMDAHDQVTRLGGRLSIANANAALRGRPCGTARAWPTGRWSSSPSSSSGT